MTIAIRRPVPGGWPQRRPHPRATDGWLDALAKLVPGEVVLVQAAMLQLPTSDGVRLAVTVALAALVPVTVWWSARRAGVPAPVLQYVIRTATFALYSLAELSWVASVGAVAIAMLAAFALVPPGAAAPPPVDPPPHQESP
jgi:hypothetical protein